MAENDVLVLANGHRIALSGGSVIEGASTYHLNLPAEPLQTSDIAAFVEQGFIADPEVMKMKMKLAHAITLLDLDAGKVLARMKWLSTTLAIEALPAARIVFDEILRGELFNLKREAPPESSG